MSDDMRLKNAVVDEIEWEPSVNGADIGVMVHAGVVTLMGHVASYSEKLAAEKAARRTNGVKAVAEELEVRLPLGSKQGDEDIASWAVTRLGGNTMIPTDSVKATVHKGWITLTGAVDWGFQRDAATDGVRDLWGVVGVTNEITIRPKPNLSAIRDDIMVALDRSWFDPATINVSAEGGTVKLTGVVRSWYERDEASKTAWSAPGTTAVENEILVN